MHGMMYWKAPDAVTEQDVAASVTTTSTVLTSWGVPAGFGAVHDGTAELVIGAVTVSEVEVPEFTNAV